MTFYVFDLLNERIMNINSHEKRDQMGRQAEMRTVLIAGIDFIWAIKLQINGILVPNSVHSNQFCFDAFVNIMNCYCKYANMSYVLLGRINFILDLKKKLKCSWNWEETFIESVYTI